MVKLNSALGWGGNIVKLNSALECSRTTQISYYVIIGIDPSVCHGFGPDLRLSWHVCSLGLDQPMTDRGILFLKP